MELAGKARWSKSFPTTQSTAVFRCTYEKNGRICDKIFRRQCDLNRHQTNHTRPFKCEKCQAGFPSPKDLLRHDSSMHGPTVLTICPHASCCSRINDLQDQLYVEYTRWDRWSKHMRVKHATSRDVLQKFKKYGLLSLYLEPLPNPGFFIWKPVLPEGASLSEKSRFDERVEELKSMVDEDSFSCQRDKFYSETLAYYTGVLEKFSAVEGEGSA